MTNGDTTLNTSGGAVTGNVQTGRDFVGRDQINFIVPLGNWEDVLHLLCKEGPRPVGKAVQKQFENFDWTKAEQAYLNKVVKLYDRIRILGSSEDVLLSNLFTQVYILDKPTARQRHDINELRKRGYDRLNFQYQSGQRIHGLDLVKTKKDLFILGKPGAGKTTFLKYITIQAAHKQLPLIPIFVSLNQWADSFWGKREKAALLPFLVEQFDICDFPDTNLFVDYLLREGRALVLFDGLDEVKQEKSQRRHLTNLIQKFVHKYDKSQYLITCRIAASDYAFDGFTDVEVADFTPDQVREYASNWFGVQTKKFEAFTVELSKAENQGLTELCNTPLLLSLLCLTFDNSMRFPPSRAELYEEAIENLLRKWDSSRQIQRDEIYRALSYKRKLQLLMSIAILTFEKGEIFFRQRDLERWIVDYLTILPGAPSSDTLDGNAILKAMEAQHSILVERAQSIYSFSHLTFQEYLAARYLTENKNIEIITELTYKYLTDERWREVFLLTASLLADAHELINLLRQAIDNIITSASGVISLLVWAQDQTKKADVPLERRSIIQLSYISLALAIDNTRFTLSRSLELSRTLFRAIAFDEGCGLTLDRAMMLMIEIGPDLAADLARIRSLAPVRTRSYTRSRSRQVSTFKPSDVSTSALGLDLSIYREAALILDPVLTLNLVRDLARATAPTVGVYYGLYYIWAYATLFANTERERTDDRLQVTMQDLLKLVKGVVELARSAKIPSLGRQLSIEIIPLPRARSREWQQYADALFNILRDTHYLGYEKSIIERDIEVINAYLYANELFVQCLKVAAISERQTILDRLLLPP